MGHIKTKIIQIFFLLLIQIIACSTCCFSMNLEFIDDPHPQGTAILRHDTQVPAGDCIEHMIAPMPGKILEISVVLGQIVLKGDSLCIFEAMKMQYVIRSQVDGKVTHIRHDLKGIIDFGSVLVSISPPPISGKPISPDSITRNRGFLKTFFPWTKDIPLDGFSPPSHIEGTTPTTIIDRAEVTHSSDPHSSPPSPLRETNPPAEEKAPHGAQEEAGAPRDGQFLVLKANPVLAPVSISTDTNLYSMCEFLDCSRLGEASGVAWVASLAMTKSGRHCEVRRTAAIHTLKANRFEEIVLREKTLSLLANSKNTLLVKRSEQDPENMFLSLFTAQPNHQNKLIRNHFCEALGSRLEFSLLTLGKWLGGLIVLLMLPLTYLARDYRFRRLQLRALQRQVSFLPIIKYLHGVDFNKRPFITNQIPYNINFPSQYLLKAA